MRNKNAVNSFPCVTPLERRIGNNYARAKQLFTNHRNFECGIVSVKLEQQ